MNEYYLIVNFKKKKIITNLEELVQNDYEAYKLKFEFDKEFERALFKLKYPTDNKIWVQEINNNELILPVLESPGIYKYEISIYSENGRLTDYAIKDFNVRSELVNTDDVVETDDRVPILDNLINDVNRLNNNITIVEETRVSNENARILAENNRNSNEETRIVNDAARETRISNLETNKADRSEIPTKVSDLINDSNFVNSTQLEQETTNRQNADLNLQTQIDAITSASDVVDIVGTYTELQNYDTTSLTADDVIKVLQDSTHNNALSYYRWTIVNNSFSWLYVGSEGPFYTKGEADALLNEKLEQSDLVDYVKNDDYANFSKGGVIKTNLGFEINSSGGAQCSQMIYENYLKSNGKTFISKSTLENVIAGKELVNKTYVDSIVGDINTAITNINSLIDTINGEVV